MSTDPFTDDDVKRLALVAFPGLPAGIDAAQAERRIRAVLDDLAVAGRLLPVPVETREERQTLFGQPEMRCEVQTFADGRTLVGPWVPVDPDTKE